MSPGDLTQGRRRDVPPDALEPGDYGCHGGQWYCRTPNGLAGNLALHDVTEHDDGAITAAPSVLVRAGTMEGERWHGYLEHGVWRSVE